MNAVVAQMIREGRAWRGYERAQIPAQATGHKILDATLPGGGWPVGALCEIVHTAYGADELCLVLPLLARLSQAGRQVALLSPPHIPHPPAFMSAGVLLRAMLIVEAPEPDLTWAAEQLLRGRIGALLLWGRRADMPALRRLQLAAEDAGSFVFWFHNGSLRQFSPAALRLRIQRAGGRTEIEVLKCRGGAIGQRLALG